MGRYVNETTSLLGQGLESPTSQDQQFGWGDPTLALYDPRFIQTLRAHFQDMGENVGALSDDELIEMFYSDRNWADLNTVGAVQDAASARSMTEEQRTRARAIQQVWRDLPNFYQEGGRGAGALGDIATSVVLDPVNLVGGAFGKAAGTAATRGALAAGRGVDDALRAGTRAGLTRGVAGQAGLEGGVGFGADAAMQDRDITLGLQDSYSLGQGLTNAAAGAAIGGLMGVPDGLLGGRAGAAEGVRQYGAMRQIGVPDEVIGGLGNRAAARAMSDPYAMGDLRTSAQSTIDARSAAAAAASAAPPPAAGRATIDQDRQNLDQMLMLQREAVEDAIRDGMDPESIAHMENVRDAIARLREMGARLASEEQMIGALEASNIPRDLNQAAARRARFETDLALFRTALTRGDDEGIEEAVRRLSERMQPSGDASATTAAAPGAPATNPAAAPASAPPAPRAAGSQGSARPRASGSASAGAGPTPPQTGEEAAFDPTQWVRVTLPDGSWVAANKTTGESLSPEDFGRLSGDIVEGEGFTTTSAGKAQLDTTAGEGSQPFRPQQAAPEGAAGATTPEADQPSDAPLLIEEAARQHAHRHGLDPRTVKGTGRRGHVKMADVKAAIAERGLARLEDDATEAFARTLSPEEVAPGAQATPQATPASGADPRVTTMEQAALEGMAKNERSAALGDQQATNLQLIRTAVEMGIDWRRAVRNSQGVNPNQAIKDAIKAAKTNGSSADDAAYQKRLGAAVDKAMKMGVEAGVQTPEQLLQFLTAIGKSDAFSGFGEDLAHYVEILMDKARVRESLYDDLADEMEWKLSKGEKKKLAQLEDQLRKQNLDQNGVLRQDAMPEEEIPREALRRLLALRDDPTPVREGKGDRSLTNSSLSRVQDASKFTNAGRNPQGKILAFMKRGIPISEGSDYTLQGIEYPRVGLFGQDEAMARATTPGNHSIVAFTASGQEHVFYMKRSNSQKYGRVPAGTLLYADGVTKKVYPSVEAILFARGEGPRPKGAAVINGPAKTVEAGTGKAKPAASEALKNADLDPNGTVAALDAALNPDKAKEIATEVGGELVMLRSRTTGKIRMMTQAQQAAGKTVRDLLGKSNPEDWEVRYAPAGKHSHNQAALQKLWDEVGDDPEARARAETEAAARLTQGEPNTPNGPPPRPIDEVNGLVSEPLTPEQAKSLVLAGRLSGMSKPPQAGQRMVLGDVERLIGNLEYAKWSDAPIGRVIDSLATLYKIRAEIVPEGIIYPMAQRQQSQDQLRAILSKHDPDAVAEAMALLDRLGGNRDLAPNIVQSTTGSKTMQDPGEWMREPAVNNLELDPNNWTYGRAAHTALNVVYHEVAHWAYANILTDADRLQFWEAMRKYETTDAAGQRDVDQAKLDERLGEPKLAGVDMTLAHARPQELFAEQFVSWLTQRGGPTKKGSLLQDETYWQKVKGYIKAIFDRYVRGNSIDPDLESLFARILPDDVEAVKFRTADPRAPETQFGKHLEKRLVETQSVREQLEEAITSGSHSGVINAHRELTRFLFSLAPRHARKADLSQDSGQVFSPVGTLTKVIRNRLRDIDELLASKVEIAAPSGAAPADLVNLGPDAVGKPGVSVLSERERLWQEAWAELRAKGYDPDALSDEQEQAIESGWDLAIEQLARQGSGADVGGGTENLSALANAAETLVRFYQGGYNAWTPEGGVPSKIKNLDATSTEALLDMIHNAMDLQYRRTEGGHAPTVMRPKSAQDRTALGKTRSPMVEKSKAKQARGVKAADQKAKDAATRQAEKTAKTSAARRQAEANPSGPKMTMAQLRKTLKGTAFDADAAQALREKILAVPAVKEVPVSGSVRQMRREDLTREFHRALSEGGAENTARANEIAWEIQRRAKKAADKPASPKPMTWPVRTETLDAVKREGEQRELGMEAPGIPRGAPAQIREMLSYITHRDPEVQSTLRLVTYRMLNLMGKVSREVGGHLNVLEANDVSRLAGLDPKSAPGAVFADFRDPHFQHLRNRFRRMSVGLVKGNTDPFDVMHEFAHAIVASGVLPREELDGVVGAYRAASGRIKEQVEKLYGGKYASLDQEARDARLAEEWFAEELTRYLGGKVVRGDLLNVDRLGSVGDIRLISGFERAIDRVVEYVAYVVNGLIGRQDIRQTFRRLTFYGDMHHEISGAPLAAMKGRTFFPPNLAGQYAADMLRSSPKGRRELVRNFVKGSYGADGNGDPIVWFHGTPNGAALRRETNPDVAVRMSTSGHWGPGFYVSADPRPPEETYAARPTGEALKAMVKAKNPDMTPEELEAAQNDLTTLVWTRSDLVQDRLRYSTILQELRGTTSPENRAVLQEELEGVASILDESAYVEQLLTEEITGKYGIEIDPYVAPLYMALKNPADFREASTSPEMVRGVVDELVRRGIINERMSQIFLEEQAQYPMGGHAVYDELSMLIDDVAERAGHARLNQILQDMGYDGILTNHTNTIGDGEDLMSNGQTRGARTLTYEAAVLFDARQVKHVDASDFDANDPRLYHREVETEELPRAVNAAIMEAVIANPAMTFPSILPSSVGSLVEKAGSTRLASATMSILKGRPLTAWEGKALMDRGPLGWFRAQSSHMRNMGMNWVADWYEDQFADAHQLFARKFTPMHRKLRSLPDVQGWLKDHVSRSTMGAVWGSQPDSHRRILSALRRPSGSRQERALSAEELQAYNEIRAALRQERRDLVAQGILMGDRGEDYFPQVHNAREIAKRREEAELVYAAYYRAESAAIGRPMKPGDDVTFGQGIVARLLDETSDGVFIPITGGSRTALSDNVDFSRMLELDKYPDILALAEPFLEDNLEATLVKYFEATTRRTSITRQMGVNNHALYDYLMTVDQGAAGIAKLLSTDKVFVKELNMLPHWKERLDGTGGPERVALTSTVAMPFHGSEARAMQFANRLIEAHKTGGAAAAKGMLNSVAPKARSGVIPLAYQRRADAIVAALGDFKGAKTGVEKREFDFLEDAMRVAMRKHRHSTTQAGAKASSAARTLNAVTLLGFTTLTSLGDVALPLIRSGSFGATYKAWKNMAQDPHYRQMMAQTGVAIEGIIHQHLLDLYGGATNKFSQAFFHATGLQPWTNLNRRLAGAVGYEALKAEQMRAFSFHKAGVALQDQPRQYKTAHRFLSRYGLAEFLPEGPRAGERLSNLALMESDETVRKAIINFANEAIFTPNANDIPLWAQTPVGSIIFQLKSFPLLMTKLAGYTFKEAKEGNPSHLAYLLTAGPLAGAGALTAKDWVQQRADEDEGEVRNRNWKRFLGYDEEIHGNENDFAGWYLESLFAMGGLGLIGDALYGVGSQLENGAYGQVRIASTILGPTFGLGVSLSEVAAGAMADDDDSNATERTGARAFSSRLPILGQQRTFREGMVDLLAGPEGDGETTPLIY